MNIVILIFKYFLKISHEMRETDSIGQNFVADMRKNGKKLQNSVI